MLGKAIQRDDTAAAKKKKKRKAFHTWPLHLMLIPGAVVVFVYIYIPMFGLVMAFQDVDLLLG